MQAVDNRKGYCCEERPSSEVAKWARRCQYPRRQVRLGEDPHARDTLRAIDCFAFNAREGAAPGAGDGGGSIPVPPAHAAGRTRDPSGVRLRRGNEDPSAPKLSAVTDGLEHQPP